MRMEHTVGQIRLDGDGADTHTHTFDGTCANGWMDVVACAMECAKHVQCHIVRDWFGRNHAVFMHCLNRSIVSSSAKGMRGRNGRGRLHIILPVHHFQSDAIDAFRIIYQHARDTTHGIHWRTDMAASPCRHIHATGLMMTLHQAAPITWTMTNHVVKRASVHPIYSDQARALLPNNSHEWSRSVRNVAVVYCMLASWHTVQIHATA